MNQYLINKLKEGRANKGLKQSDVANRIGVKGNTLSNYENGVSEPDIDTFCLLCEIYDLDPAEILEVAYGLNNQSGEFNIRPDEIEYIKKYRALDTHGKEMVDFTLQKEWERSTQYNNNNVIPMLVAEESNNYLASDAAHTDKNATPEKKKFDDNIMNDDDEWK